MNRVATVLVIMILAFEFYKKSILYDSVSSIQNYLVGLEDGRLPEAYRSTIHPEQNSFNLTVISAVNNGSQFCDNLTA